MLIDRTCDPSASCPWNLCCGVHTLSWQTGVLGVVMALAVPAIAWIEELALLLVLAAFAFIVRSPAIFWWLGEAVAPSAETPG